MTVDRLSESSGGNDWRLRGRKDLDGRLYG